MVVNLGAYAKAAKEYLAKGFETARCYSKTPAAKYTLEGILLLGLLAAEPGCPWDNHHKDRDTTSGSSAPKELSKAGKNAIEKRLGYSALYLTGAGTQAQYVVPKEESDQLLKWLASAGDGNQDANSYIDAHRASEEAADWKIICGEVPLTTEQYRTYFKYLCRVWTDGIVAAQTTDSAPKPVEGPIVNYEVDNETDGSGQGMGVDFVNNKITYFLKTPDGSELPWPTYTFNDEQMITIKAAIKKSLTQTYLYNEEKGYDSYYPNGAQVLPSVFDE